MANRYANREAIKAAGNIMGTADDQRIDDAGAAASANIERITRRSFIPRTETRTYRYPERFVRTGSGGMMLWLDQDLLSVDTLKTQAQDSSPTTIASSDYFLEPNNPGVDGLQRFNRVEIDTSSSAALASGATPQRSIEIVGDWGWWKKTTTLKATAAEAIDISETDIDVDRVDQVAPGDMILIDSEQMVVQDWTWIAPTSAVLLDGALTKTKNQVAITVDTGHGIVAGELIMVDAEQMLVLSLTGATTLNVVRDAQGSVLAAHDNNTALQVRRRLTVERGANGSTAATHNTASAIARYDVPGDIHEWAVAEALVAFAQGGAQYGRVIGSGDAGSEASGRSVTTMRKEIGARYRRARIEAI